MVLPLVGGGRSGTTAMVLYWWEVGEVGHCHGPAIGGRWERGTTAMVLPLVGGGRGGTTAMVLSLVGGGRGVTTATHCSLNILV